MNLKEALNFLDKMKQFVIHDSPYVLSVISCNSSLIRAKRELNKSPSWEKLFTVFDLWTKYLDFSIPVQELSDEELYIQSKRIEIRKAEIDKYVLEKFEPIAKMLLKADKKTEAMRLNIVIPGGEITKVIMKLILQYIKEKKNKMDHKN
jgi:hypothetical protein